VSLPPTLAIYIGAIDELQMDPALIASPERRAAVTAPQHEDLRRSRIADWHLLRLGLSRSFGLREEDLTFRRDANGRWHCDGPCFSLTHTDHYAACVLSDLPAGMDAEEPALFAARFRTDRLRTRMQQTICTPEELTRLQNGETDLLRLWLMKESLFKLEGGASFVPDRVDTLREDVRVIDLSAALPVQIAVAGARVGMARVFLCGADGIREYQI